MFTWNQGDRWIAVFDILGFKNLIREADQKNSHELLKDKLNELIQTLNSDPVTHGHLDYRIFSDTFVVLAPDLEPNSYPWFLRACKNLIDKSIYIELPLRGAISVGSIFIAMNHPVLLGSSFVEAYEYCEDQNWIGLLLTPSATSALREN